VTITDITATQLAITLAAEETIIADSDSDFGIQDLMVLPGNVISGQGVVFYGANGNNITDDGALGAFEELRPFVYSSLLANGHMIATPLQVGSDSATGLVFQPHFNSLEDDAELGAAVTPLAPSSRDFGFDSDTASPDFVHLIANEYDGVHGSEEGTSYVGRVLDMRASSSLNDAQDRFRPLLTASPFRVGTQDGHEFEDIDEPTLDLIPQGNSLVAIFNTETHDDNGNDGKFFVNAYRNGIWSDAALLSNDSVEPIEDDENPFSKSGENWEILRGVNQGCDYATGTWLFWLREDANGQDSSTESLTLQGRRVFDTSMSRN
jgi:hypothetical protein